MNRQVRSSARRPVQYYVAKQPILVSKCLQEAFRLSPEKIETLLALGAIYHQGKRILEDREIKTGAKLTIHMEPRRYPVDRVDWSSLILHETPDFVVVNKPYGIPVHATVDNRLDNALHGLRQLTGHHLLVTQRLDLPVGGLMVFAKTDLFQRDFNRWLEERKVKKRYRALSHKLPVSGHHVHFMEPSEKDPRRVSPTPKPDWIRCELTIHRAVPTLWQGREFFDIEVELHTGRLHQIRAQLAALGSPILGDRIYGSTFPYSSETGRAIALFSASVGWNDLTFHRDPPWIQSPSA